MNLRFTPVDGAKIPQLVGADLYVAGVSDGQLRLIVHNKSVVNDDDLITIPSILLHISIGHFSLASRRTIRFPNDGEIAEVGRQFFSLFGKKFDELRATDDKIVHLWEVKCPNQ